MTFSHTLDIIFRLIWLFVNVRPVNSKTFKLGMMSPFRHPRLGWEINAAAATIAVETAQSDGLVSEHNIRYFFFFIFCTVVFVKVLQT